MFWLVLSFTILASKIHQPQAFAFNKFEGVFAPVMNIQLKRSEAVKENFPVFWATYGMSSPSLLLHVWEQVCTCVCRCTCTQTMCVEARGWSWVSSSFSLHPLPFLFFFWTGSITEPRACQIGQMVWPVSSRLPVFIPAVLRSQMCTSGPRACTSALGTDPFPTPLVLFPLTKV